MPAGPLPMTHACAPVRRTTLIFPARHPSRASAGTPPRQPCLTAPPGPVPGAPTRNPATPCARLSPPRLRRRVARQPAPFRRPAQRRQPLFAGGVPPARPSPSLRAMHSSGPCAAAQPRPCTGACAHARARARTRAFGAGAAPSPPCRRRSAAAGRNPTHALPRPTPPAGPLARRQAPAVVTVARASKLGGSCCQRTQRAAQLAACATAARAYTQGGARWARCARAARGRQDRGRCGPRWRATAGRCWPAMDDGETREVLPCAACRRRRCWVRARRPCPPGAAWRAPRGGRVGARPAPCAGARRVGGRPVIWGAMRRAGGVARARGSQGGWDGAVQCLGAASSERNGRGAAACSRRR